MTTKNPRELEEVVSTGEARAEWGAWAVIAGLFMEVALALASTFGLESKPVEHWGTVFATALIAGGVYCEIRFGRASSDAQKALRAISDAEVAAANASAAKAHERAATLEKEAADARARTAEIERLTAWRRLTFEQKEAIILGLRRKLPPEITIECVFDPEAIAFADTLSDMFSEVGGVNVQRLASPMPPDGRLEFGLSISSSMDVHALLVKEAFEKAGITMTKFGATFDVKPRMTVYVGYKPEYRKSF